MKLIVSNKTIVTRYTEEINVDIFIGNYIGASSFVFDADSAEYRSFVESMVATFDLAGYELSNNPEWTHKSNRGSESWYYTFLKSEDNIEIKIVVNVRVSNHTPHDKPWGTHEQLRSKYARRLAEEIAKDTNQSSVPYPASINVIIDGKSLKSYYAAVVYIRRQLIEIEEAIAEDE